MAPMVALPSMAMTRLSVSITLRFYDRWGNLMFINENFVPNQPSLGWDGRFNGKPVVPGVFVYVFEVEINGVAPGFMRETLP